MAFNSFAAVIRSIAARFESPIFNNLLVSTANKIAEGARSNASWSSKIPDTIRVGEAEFAGTVSSIDVYIDLKSPNGPMAAAFEYGSGLHGEKGAKYPIVAVNAPYLVFYWEKEKRWAKFDQVMHPGVEARPFLQPAADANIGFLKSKVTGMVAKVLADGLGVTITYA